MRKQYVFGCAAAAFLTGAVLSAISVFGQAVNTDVTPAPPANSGMGGAAAPAAGGADVAPQAAPGFRAVGAGHERVVVLSGKTYLNGVMGGGGGGGRRGGGRAALPAGEEVVWSKESGPGSVTFVDSAAVNTTASFDKLGDYVLKVVSKLGNQSNTDTVLVHVEPDAPSKPLTAVATVDYSLDNPLWNDRIKSHIVGWIPHCVEQLETPDLRNGGGGIDNFLDAGKKLKGENVTQAHVGMCSPTRTHTTFSSR